MDTSVSEHPRTARGGVSRATAAAAIVALLTLIMRELPDVLRAHTSAFSPWPRTVAFGLAGAISFGLLSGWVDRDPWRRAGLVALLAGLALAALGWWASLV